MAQVRFAEVWFYLNASSDDEHGVGRMSPVTLNRSPETHEDAFNDLIDGLEAAYHVVIEPSNYGVEVEGSPEFQVDEFEVEGLACETPEGMMRSVKALNMIADAIFDWYKGAPPTTLSN